MKTPAHQVILGLCLAILIMGTIIYTNSIESNTTIRNKETEVRYHKAKADSANHYAKLTRDSLTIAFATMRSLNAQREAERELRIKAEEKYRSVTHVRFKTDEQRDSVLKVLYPR